MNDLELWQLLKNGDRTAFKKIYADHVQALYKYGLRFCKDAALVEDCIHDLFVEIWNKRTTIGNTDSIIRYLLVSLRRKIYRQTKTKNKVELNDQLLPKEDDSFNWPADDHLEDRKIEVQAAIKLLTPNQQEVIYLKYFQGLDYEEISEVLGMKYQSVRNLVHRAMTKLRDHFPIIYLLLFPFIEYSSPFLCLCV